MQALKNLSALSEHTRRETVGSTEFLVVPVIALVEGVIHAMNTAGPELVRAEEFAPTLKSWEGKPVFVGHPLVNGRPVSGNLPGILQSAVGRVHNAKVKDKQLHMEAWIDLEQADFVDLNLLNRIESDEPIEISIGAFCQTDYSEKGQGVYEGKSYSGEWHNLVPDHLALLPEDVTGACSREMGCGVRAAQKGEVMYAEWLTEGPETDELLRVCRNIPMSVRDKMPAADFAGPNKSFPIQEPIDVQDAARAIGRAKGNPDTIKAKIISIAYRKGASFVAKLPEAWKKKKDQKNASTFAKIMETFRAAVFSTDGEASDSDIRTKLMDALVAKEPVVKNGGGYISDVYDNAFVYCVYEMGMDLGMDYYERSFTMDEAGNITIGDPVNVERVVSYEPVAAAGARHSTKDQNMVQGMHDQSVALGAKCPGYAAAESGNPAAEKETEMTKCELTKFLETATEEQLKAMAAIAKPATPEELKAAADAKAAEEKTAADKKAADDAAAIKAAETKEDEPKPPTFAELLDKADPDTKAAIKAAQKTAADKKAATIATLKASKRCEYSDAELKAMEQSQLDKLVALVGGDAKVDYSGLGAVRAETSEKAVPSAPDLNAKILERNKK